MQDLFKGFKNIICILGAYKKPFRLGYFVAVLEQTTSFVPYFILFYTIKIGLEREFVLSDFYTVLVAMIASIILRIVFKRLQDALQQDKGYYALAKSRLDITKHLERLNMGYYTDGNIGNISSIVSSDIVFVEEFGIFQMGLAVSSIISVVFSLIFLILFDHRLGILYLIMALLCIYTLDKLLKKQQQLSRDRQDGLANLSHSLLSFIKGIQVIKAFNMMREKNSDIEEKIEETKNQPSIW